MCAILGVSFAEGSDINRRKFAAALLSAGESRGKDASGFAFVGPGGDGVYKKDVPGSKLHVGRIPTDATAMILHTRQGTHGSPRDMENNHPVMSPSGNIRLVHNGVIYNHQEIRDLLGKVGKTLPEVDSSVIPALIEEYGLDATSELGGYASAAWFDRDTGDTIHLARFKTSTVFFAPLWDGSFAFASSADILARSLAQTGVDWYGHYPAPFDSLSEGDYLQIMGGEILTESTVEWKHAYVNRGKNWYSTTGVGSKTSADASVTHIGTAKVGSPNKSEDKPKGFANSTSKALVVVDHSPNASQGFDEFEDEFDADGYFIDPASRRDGSIVSMLFSNPEDEDDDGDMTAEEYAHWRETGQFFRSPESTGDPDEEDERIPYLDTALTGNAMYFTQGHDGDYMTYTSAEGLRAALKWNASLNAGENALVGPEEGNLRWVNQFADLGTLSEETGKELSWVKDDAEFQVFAFLFPDWVREGILKLRNLVGA